MKLNQTSKLTIANEEGIHDYLHHVVGIWTSLAKLFVGNEIMKSWWIAWTFSFVQFEPHLKLAHPQKCTHESFHIPFHYHMLAIWTHVKFINHHPQLWTSSCWQPRYFCNPLNLRTNIFSLLLYDSKKIASNLQCITIKTKIYSPQFYFFNNIFINLIKFCSNNEVMQHACKWPKVFSYLESMVGSMF